MISEYHIKALNTAKTGSKQLHEFVRLINNPLPKVGDKFKFKNEIYIIQQVEIKEKQVQ